MQPQSSAANLPSFHVQQKNWYNSTCLPSQDYGLCSAYCRANLILCAQWAQERCCKTVPVFQAPNIHLAAGESEQGSRGAHIYVFAHQYHYIGVLILCRKKAGLPPVLYMTSHAPLLLMAAEIAWDHWQAQNMPYRVISPDFPLKLTEFFPGKHLIHFLCSR